ncbi:MAG TPA: type II toxin-antitoxin system RelE/ParE family toxin [Chitinophagaceae bacterium]
MVQEIIWATEAKNNLADIKNYISIDSEYYALKIINLIYLSVQKLLKFPEAGMVIYQTEIYKVRRVLIKRYSVLYIIQTNKVYIIAVYHQSKQLPASFDFLESF